MKLQAALRDVEGAIKDLNEKGKDGAGKLQLTGDKLEEYHRM